MCALHVPIFKGGGGGGGGKVGGGTDSSIGLWPLLLVRGGAVSLIAKCNAAVVN